MTSILGLLFGSGRSPVGAWHVDAVNAPFVPHLFVFHSDGTLLTTNPTNVQETAIPGHPGGVNDSVGMGRWQRRGGKVVGTFEQLNADARTHKPAETLRVTFEIKLLSDDHAGPQFSGPAIVHFGDQRVDDATLYGQRRIEVSTSDLELIGS